MPVLPASTRMSLWRQDDDNDGIADVNQIPTRQLIERKFKLSMAAVAEPERPRRAGGGEKTSRGEVNTRTAQAAPAPPL